MSEPRVSDAEVAEIRKHFGVTRPYCVTHHHVIAALLDDRADARQALSDRDARITQLEAVDKAARRFADNESAMRTEPTYDSQEAAEEAVAAYNALYEALYPATGEPRGTDAVRAAIREIRGDDPPSPPDVYA